MKEFIFKTALFLFLITSSLMVLLLLPDHSSHFANVMDKQKMIKQIPSPKIVFIGGSNLIFGLNTPMMRDQLNKNAFNMGIHANFGLRYMCEEIKEHITSGDIVVVVPEYQQFFNKTLEGENHLLEYLRVYPKNIHYLKSFKQLGFLLGTLPDHFSKKFKRLIFKRGRKAEETYFGSESNALGDIVGHLDKPSEDNKKKPLFVADVSSDTFNLTAIEILNNLHQYVETMGASLVLIYPAISTHHYQQNHEIINFVHEKLKNNVTLKIIGSPADHIYPIEYFFDTVYHLNRAGRQDRTQRIIEQLKTELNL